MSKRLDDLAEAMWFCLPADSMMDLFAKVSKRVGGGIKKRAVDETLRYVRKNCDRLGWTVPHVKRGKASTGRFIRILTEKSGAMVFDRDGDRSKLEDGLHGTVAHTASMNRNEAKALWAASQHSRSPKYRDYIAGLAEDCEALSKKAARVAKILKFNVG